MTAWLGIDTYGGRFSGVDPALWVAAVTSILAGLIHYAVVPEHLTEWWVYAAFFCLLGAFELVWAALVLTGGERPLLMAGLVVNVLVLALWTVTRTSGLPFGPFAWQPEEIGIPDVACCIAEAATVLSVIFAWRRAGTARHDLGVGREEAAVSEETG